MKIVHFSDIHLSDKNYTEFERNFKDALIEDLLLSHRQDPIDLIVITGDLLDKGGHSLKKIDGYTDIENPFDIFNSIFINPIKESLSFDNSNFLLIPGNHDIDEADILWVDEKKMKSEINVITVDSYLRKNVSEINSSNLRIKNFKDFEKEFHSTTDNYKFSNNQSTYVYTSRNGIKFGFLLVNDSWRCSTCTLEDPEKNHHYFGIGQLHEGLKTFKDNLTNINICLFHHPIEVFKEKDELEKILSFKDLHVYLFGHYHKSLYEKVIKVNGSCLGFRGRGLLNKPDEEIIDFKPGYQIFTLSKDKVKIIEHRIYNSSTYSFISDTFTAPENGLDKGEGGNGYQFSNIKNKVNLDSLNVSDFNQD